MANLPIGLDKAVVFTSIFVSAALIGCTGGDGVKSACLEFKKYSESSDTKVPLETMQKKFFDTLGVTFYGSPENTEQMMANVKAIQEANAKCKAAGAGEMYSVN